MIFNDSSIKQDSFDGHKTVNLLKISFVRSITPSFPYGTLFFL